MTDSRFCHIPHTKGMSDTELKAAVKDLFNGEYAKIICRGCGLYLTNEDGNHTTAKIVSKCKSCFDPK